VTVPGRAALAHRVRALCRVAPVVLLLPAPLLAQSHATHADTSAAHREHGAPAESPGGSPGGHDMHPMHDMPGMDMSDHEMSGAGFYGPYPISREASGTSWQPQAAPHRGVHLMRGGWMLMLHGMAHVAYTHQGGPRGDDDVYSDNMIMGMVRRPLPTGTLGFRAMLSAEPATIGAGGYPRLLQTGETADGVTPLVDRQHPHDLFMELAGTYRLVRGSRAIFLYAGLPGEPALGPPAFMHRFSGLDFPQAPITHHWLDSTHITYGVLTGGAVADRLKFEASAFRGREPDAHRWDIESPKLDSHAFRLSFNPVASWALQASYGRIESPEQLEPEVDQDRTTVSAMVDRDWSGGHWEATVAWGRNRNRPGHTLDGMLGEATAEFHHDHVLLARIERVEKDELFAAPDARAGQVFTVSDLSAGYRYDVRRTAHVSLGVGVLGSLSLVPEALHDAYGGSPASVLAFLHAGLR
jgi:hypothetical protein